MHQLGARSEEGSRERTLLPTSGGRNSNHQAAHKPPFDRSNQQRLLCTNLDDLDDHHQVNRVIPKIDDSLSDEYVDEDDYEDIKDYCDVDFASHSSSSGGPPSSSNIFSDDDVWWASSTSKNVFNGIHHVQSSTPNHVPAPIFDYDREPFKSSPTKIAQAPTRPPPPKIDGRKLCDEDDKQRSNGNVRLRSRMPPTSKNRPRRHSMTIYNGLSNLLSSFKLNNNNQNNVSAKKEVNECNFVQDQVSIANHSTESSATNIKRSKTMSFGGRWWSGGGGGGGGEHKNNNNDEHQNHQAPKNSNTSGHNQEHRVSLEPQTKLNESSKSIRTNSKPSLVKSQTMNVKLNKVLSQEPRVSEVVRLSPPNPNNDLLTRNRTSASSLTGSLFASRLAAKSSNNVKLDVPSNQPSSSVRRQKTLPNTSSDQSSTTQVKMRNKTRLRSVADAVPSANASADQQRQHAIDMITKRLSLPANLNLPKTFLDRIDRDLERVALGQNGTGSHQDTSTPLWNNGEMSIKMRRESLVGYIGKCVHFVC